MRIRTLAIVAAVVLTCAACRSSHDGGKASHEDVEASRATARENVPRLGQEWKKTNDFGLYRLDVRDDPTIGPGCPQGDGWADAALVDKTTTQTVRLLKCSTVSASLGCMTSATFDGTAHKQEDGVCDK